MAAQTVGFNPKLNQEELQVTQVGNGLEVQGSGRVNISDFLNLT